MCQASGARCGQQHEKVCFIVDESQCPSSLTMLFIAAEENTFEDVRMIYPDAFAATLFFFGEYL